MRLGQRLGRRISSLPFGKKDSAANRQVRNVRVWLGWILLAVSFLVGCSTAYVNAFTDEADNFVVGLLLARGYVLYRDLFSHHFPFPYYWVAAVVSLFGKSILALRLSVGNMSPSLAVECQR